MEAGGACVTLLHLYQTTRRHSSVALFALFRCFFVFLPYFLSPFHQSSLNLFPSFYSLFFVVAFSSDSVLLSVLSKANAAFPCFPPKAALSRFALLLCFRRSGCDRDLELLIICRVRNEILYLGCYHVCPPSPLHAPPDPTPIHPVLPELEITIHKYSLYFLHLSISLFITVYLPSSLHRLSLSVGSTCTDPSGDRVERKWPWLISKHPRGFSKQ